ncbi:hypothetical protein LTR81_023733 [Elasticomyces elasticus]
MPGSYDEMDAPQDRQRDVANIPGDEEASTLTKRTCLNILDAESSGNRELAKITELTRTDFPAVVESDGADCSRFRYCGALAFTSADELEREGRDIWTGTRPTIMLTARFCKPRDLHILATDGRLTDEFLNTIPVLGDCKDTDGYLLQTFVVRLIKEARFRDLDRWTMAVPKQSKPWLFGLHESDHWMAVRIDWTGRLVQHYDPMHQKLTRRIRRTLQGCIVVGSA